MIYIACARYHIYRRCYLETETQEEDEIGRLLGEATTYVTIKEKRPLNKQDLKLQGFVNFLEDSYKKYSVLKLFPCNEDVDAEKLHTDCQCLVTSEDGKEFTVSSDKCFTQAVLSLKPRVLLTGETGYGKSTLIYKFVDQWRKEINKTLLVFYLELADVEMGVPIEDLIHKELIHQLIMLMSQDTQVILNKDMNLTNGTVVVDEDCSLVYLTSCSLPSLDRLVIAKRHLSEEDLLSIVSWASKEVHCFLTVQFVQCQLPDAIGILEELKSLVQEKNTKIERKESDGNILELDTSEGKWNAIQVHADQAQDDVT